MKLLSKSTKFNKMVYTVSLDGDEKFLSENDIIKEFKKIVTDEYFGFGSRVDKFEDRAVITVYTD